MRSTGSLLLVILAGCASASPSNTPGLTSSVIASASAAASASPMATSHPATPAPYADLEPDDVLLLRADTQLWTVQEERTVSVPASIVVYADGLVIADVERLEEFEWRAIQLTPEELEIVTVTLAGTRPQEAPVNAINNGCICHVRVIQARTTGGELVEIAAAGGVSPWDPDEPPAPDVKPWMIALDRALDHLQFLAEHRKEVATTRVVPPIPAGASIEG
jgi:hypothetical protein